MADTFDLILKGGKIISHMGQFQGDIGVRNGRIAAIGDLHEGKADTVMDLAGLHILPGVIDTQVHFREPGNEHKEDLASGSRAAVMGGVTAVFEMPNTNPLTTSVAALEEKLNRAKGRMWCDHAFYVGATAENAEDLGELEKTPGCCGVKVFMGASTGDLLVADDETLAVVLAHGRRRVAIHAEDNVRLDARQSITASGNVADHPNWRDDDSAFLATKRVVKIARKAGRRIHVLHVTTPQELEFLAQNKDIASVEVTPQHLTLYAPDCYERLGSKAQMNPPIRSKAHRDGLWHWVQQGVADVIGSDHAPHCLDEKEKPYPQSPSGMPGVQTLLPLMLDHVANGRMSLQHLVDMTSHSAQRLFNLREKGRIALGYHADFTIVDLKREWTVDKQWLASKCGWSPFEGMTLTGKPIGTLIQGRIVMWQDELVGEPEGAPIRFQENISG